MRKKIRVGSRMISSIKNFISKFHSSLTKVSRVQTPDKNPLTDSIFLNWFWLNSSMKYQNSGKSEPKAIFEFVESFFFWWIKVSQKGTIKQNLNFRAYSSNFIFMINVTIKEEKKNNSSKKQKFQKWENSQFSSVKTSRMKKA